MNKQKIFISSVQTEFAVERQMLNDYINTLDEKYKTKNAVYVWWD